MGIIGDNSEQEELGWLRNRFWGLRNFRESVTEDMDDQLARSTYIAGLMLGIKGLFMLASTISVLVWKPIELAIWNIPLDETHLLDAIGFPVIAALLIPFTAKEIVRLHMKLLGWFNKGFSNLVNRYMMYKWKKNKQDSDAAQALAKSQAKYLGFLYRFSPQIRQSFVNAMVWSWILYITLDHSNVAHWLTIAIYEPGI